MHHHSPVLQPWDFQPIHIMNNTQQSVFLSKYKLMYNTLLYVTVIHIVSKKGIRRDRPRPQD